MVRQGSLLTPYRRQGGSKADGDDGRHRSYSVMEHRRSPADRLRLQRV